MNAVEQGEAMQLIANNYYYFDVCYLRDLDITEKHIELCKDVLSRFPNLYYWQVGKIINLDNDITKYLMEYLGYEVVRLPEEQERTLIQYTSRFRLFDGAAEVRARFEPGKNLYRKTYNAEDLKMNFSTFRDTMDAVRLPYKEEVLTMAKYFNIDIEQWKLTSFDVNAILTDRLDNRITRCSVRNQKDLGLYAEKEMLVRYTLASCRIAKNMNTSDVARLIGVSSETYERIEACCDHPTVPQAQKLALLLGIDNIQDIYVARIMPANYEYVLNQRVNLNTHYLTEKFGLTHTRKTDSMNAKLAEIESNAILKANRYCEMINNKYRKEAKHAKQA